MGNQTGLNYDTTTKTNSQNNDSTVASSANGAVVTWSDTTATDTADNSLTVTYTADLLDGNGTVSVESNDQFPIAILVLFEYVL